ncbi:MAG: tetratricopeptide repeat protein [Chthoniobacterales bacterium]
MNELSPKTFRLILLICLLVQPFLPAPAAAAETKSALNADASLQAAFTALKKKNYPRALSELEPALEQRGNDPVVLNLKGAILTKMKDYSGAQACYDKALKASPNFFPARYNMGALLPLRQQWDPAISYFRDLLIEQPNNELVQFKLLLLLLRQNADQQLQEKLFSSDSPSSTPAWYYASAARAYQKGKPSEAAKYIDVAQSVFGDQTGIFQEELDESGLKDSKK